jgi:quercetin dioxygenase-like cupin family protein
MTEYFSTDTPATASLRILHGAELPIVELAPGITAAVLLGERLNINVVTLEPTVVAPVHTHPEEQMGYVARGSCDFTDGTETRRLEPGDTYHAPPGSPHGATARENGCVIIDVFAPPRAGLADMVSRAERG